MKNTQPVSGTTSGTMPVDRQPPLEQELRQPERNIVYAVGVILLLFGSAITGHHQASLAGLALIVLCNLL